MDLQIQLKKWLIVGSGLILSYRILTDYHIQYFFFYPFLSSLLNEPIALSACYYVLCYHVLNLVYIKLHYHILHYIFFIRSNLEIMVDIFLYPVLLWQCNICIVSLQKTKSDLVKLEMCLYSKCLLVGWINNYYLYLNL